MRLNKKGLVLGHHDQGSCDRCARAIRFRLCKFHLDEELTDIFNQGVAYGKKLAEQKDKVQVLDD